MNNQGGMQGGNNPLPVAPGLNAVIGSCHRLYPTQKNPLQVKNLKPKKNFKCLSMSRQHLFSCVGSKVIVCGSVRLSYAKCLMLIFGQC